MSGENAEQYQSVGGLKVATCLKVLIDQAVDGLDIAAQSFWDKFEHHARILSGENKALLAERTRLQEAINGWHTDNSGPIENHAAYQSFLTDIGYIAPEPEDFKINPAGIDPELSTLAGPQLVVPINNARYALNAANARWGSLYDALYGTNVIPEDGELAPGASYNTVRGNAVIAYAKGFLDTYFPLATGSHADCVAYSVGSRGLQCLLSDGSATTLTDPSQAVGYDGEQHAPSAVLLVHNGLHIEIKIDRPHPVGSTDKAGVCDVMVEAALSTIMDCEDSVAAVSPEEKTEVYRNWLGLIQGDLTAELRKGDKTITRSLNPDRRYRGFDGAPVVLKGRSLLLVRNVGHLMTTDAVLLDGEPVPEGILDGFVTALISIHDLNAKGRFKNSVGGSIYIVKPKMHGPDEVAFAAKLFDAIEDSFGLARNTLKIGIMDEERRTSVNLKACIHAVKDRVFFINTGFLDRTGDDIHTTMYAGAVIPKNDIKHAQWLHSYERRNVSIGLQCGFSGVAQIGKGMWAKPDEMADMMAEKVGHPKAGAVTAWVPSPTAATLHALHYHQVDVFKVQQELANGPIDGLDTLLAMPLQAATPPPREDVQRELEGNAQSILGYVVRWIDAGVGCSKVPDINDVGLMEDRATLRISSQHIANWLKHGICTEQDVAAAFERMALVVDEQNSNDPSYQAMSDNLQTNHAYQASLALAFKGADQPSGYTEPLLDHYRRQKLRQTLA